MNPNLDVSFDPFGGGGQHQGGWAAPGANDSSFVSQAQGVLPTAAPPKNDYERYYIPVSIAQLRSVPVGEDRITIGQYSFANIRCICKIAEADENTGPQATYRVMDVNGLDDQVFSVMHYLDVSGARSSQTFTEGTIVYMIGKIRTFDTSNSAVVYNMFPVDDVEQIACFPKEARCAELFFAKDVPNRHAELADQLSATFMSPYTPDSRNPATAPAQTRPANQPVVNVMPARTFNDARFTHPQIQNQQQQKIYNLLVNGDKEAGCHIDAIKEKIGGNSSSFDADMDHLTNSGVIYITMDDFHYSIVPA